MKKTFFSLFFAFAMILSTAFVAEIGSTQNPFAAQAQTASVKKKKRVGAIRYIGRGTKYVGKKIWHGTKWTGLTIYRGSKYIGKKTWKGTKWLGRRIY